MKHGLESCTCFIDLSQVTLGLSSRIYSLHVLQNGFLSVVARTSAGKWIAPSLTDSCFLFFPMRLLLLYLSVLHVLISYDILLSHSLLFCYIPIIIKYTCRKHKCDPSLGRCAVRRRPKGNAQLRSVQPTSPDVCTVVFVLLCLTSIISGCVCASSEHLKLPLEDYMVRLPKVRILRTKKREGLIRTRLLGAALAKGDVITFLDSHCEANVNWLPPLLGEDALVAVVISLFGVLSFIRWQILFGFFCFYLLCAYILYRQASKYLQ